jgi:hypothetical protein
MVVARPGTNADGTVTTTRPLVITPTPGSGSATVPDSPTVGPATETVPTRTATAPLTGTTDTTSANGPGFGVACAVLVVLVVTASLTRRTRTGAGDDR